MKKIYISMLAVAAMLLSSCEREKDFRDITIGENELSFVMQGVSTRSAVEGSPYVTKGISIPMGDGMYLEETVEELNPSPMTKGAPAYTATLPNLYPTLGVYAEGNFGDAVFDSMDKTQYDENGWRYNHNYAADPWPDNSSTPVDFYLRMPATGDGLEYDATTFKLTSPENGKEQVDLLFGQVSVSKKEHNKKLPAGVPVTMQHALTGIKFRNGHLNNNQTKTIITHVALVGLNTYGEGTVGENGEVEWTTVSTPNTEDNPFYLEFDNPTYEKAAGKDNPDGTVQTWDAGLDGTTWTAAAADRNLNNAKGELTFWFIPQQVPDNLKLHIIFRVKTPDTPEGVDVPHTIDLGELLNGRYQEAGNTGNLKWEAGQLRTYTLKPFDVDVEIMDEMTATVKSQLHVANTGNVDEYVRMLIMGNWYGWKPGTTEAEMKSTEPSILVGYKYKDAASTPAGHSVNEMVDPWFRGGYDDDNDPTTPNVDPYGHFDETFTLADLKGLGRDGNRDDWADASGGYYYTMPIGPGEGVGDGAQSATTALFGSYTVTNPPQIWLPVGNTREEAVGVHLVMEIVIQAIAVPTNDDGTPSKWWLEAWYDATGIAKLNPDATRNAAYKKHYTDGDYAPETSGSGN